MCTLISVVKCLTLRIGLSYDVACWSDINHKRFTYLVTLFNDGHTNVSYIWQNLELSMSKT